MGVGRVPARIRLGDPCRRLAGRPVRHEADVHGRLGGLRRCLRLVWGCAEPGRTRRVPHPPGLRRRADHADRQRHALPGVPARRAFDRNRRRAERGGRRSGDRPGARWGAGRQHLVAMDLLREPSDRCRRPDPRGPVAPRGATRRGGSPRPARPGPVGDGRVAADLHALDGPRERMARTADDRDGDRSASHRSSGSW